MGSVAERYRVTVFPAEGGAVDYSVLTWNGANKAIAIAVEEFLITRRKWWRSRFKDLTAHIVDVSVDYVGLPDTGENDVIVPLPRDLMDRMEW